MQYIEKKGTLNPRALNQWKIYSRKVGEARCREGL